MNLDAEITVNFWTDMNFDIQKCFQRQRYYNAQRDSSPRERIWTGLRLRNILAFYRSYNLLSFRQIVNANIWPSITVR